DAAFVHDTVFVPDSGTARADFPGGSASQLYRSIMEILSLPDETRIFVGHDYQPGGREPKWESTGAEEKATNIHMSKCRTEEEIVTLREERDRTLPMPRLVVQALQVHINARRLPEPEPNGTRYLRIPLNILPAANWGWGGTAPFLLSLSKGEPVEGRVTVCRPHGELLEPRGRSSGFHFSSG